LAFVKAERGVGSSETGSPGEIDDQRNEDNESHEAEEQDGPVFLT
jgi:hypothetical protein